MRNKKAVLIWGFLILLLMLSFYFDDKISVFFEMLRFSILDNILMGITYASSGIIVFFILTSLFLWQEKKRAWILPLWCTLFVTTAVSYILKITVQRLRPIQEGIVQTIPSLIEANFSSWNYSFPSYQSALAFCAIPILNREFPKLKYAWWTFAVLIALSRVYFGLHYMSDVISGAFIGFIIGSFVLKNEKENNSIRNFARKWIK